MFGRRIPEPEPVPARQNYHLQIIEDFHEAEALVEQIDNELHKAETVVECYARTKADADEVLRTCRAKVRKIVDGVV